MTSLLAFLADALLGPRCPAPACGHRARGPRSLDKHVGRWHG